MTQEEQGSKPSADAGPSQTPSPVQQFRQERREGRSTSAADFLANHPDLVANKSLLLDLAYEEYCLRQEAGEKVDPDEFCGRFPHFMSSVRRLLLAHRLLEAAPSGPDHAHRGQFPQLGENLLGFHIVEELGRGAFARVYLAHEQALGNRQVAIKVSVRGGAEASILGKLAQPNIVPVYSVQEDSRSGMTVVCMPYLGRATLCDLLDRIQHAGIPAGGQAILAISQEANKGLAAAADSSDPGLRRGRYVDAIVHLAWQLADALAFVHGKGLLHRDLKPSNVLLTPTGRPMLLDFNLSLETDSALPSPILGGTLPYMSPEQLLAFDFDEGRAHGLDGRSDVFSLGVAMYELLTGKHPFGPVPLSGSMNDLRLVLIERQRLGPGPLRDINPEVDIELERTILRCLAYDANLRPESAQVLARQLKQHLSAKQRLSRWAHRRRGLLALVGVVFFAAAVATILWLWLRPPYHIRELQSGRDAYSRGRYSEAMQHFSNAIDNNPGDGRVDKDTVLFSRARAYLRMDQVELALADLYEAEKLDGTGQVKALIGYCLNLTQQHPAAALRYAQSVQAGFATPEVYNNLGFSYLQDGRPDLARPALDKAISLNPGLQAAYCNRALADYQRALQSPTVVPLCGIEDIQKAIELGPESVDLYRHAAWMAAYAGQSNAEWDATALVYLKKAISLGYDPNVILQDAAFDRLRDKPAFTHLKATPHPTVTPIPVTRLLDPIDSTAY